MPESIVSTGTESAGSNAKADELTLFDEIRAEMQSDARPEQALQSQSDEMPHLSLVPPDEESETPEAEAVDAVASAIKRVAIEAGFFAGHRHGTNRSGRRDKSADPDDARSWSEETGDSDDLIADSPEATGTFDASEIRTGRYENQNERQTTASIQSCDDQSAVEDIVLGAANEEAMSMATEDDHADAAVSEATKSAATITGKPMPELPRRGDISRLGVHRPGVAPKRIGKGRLVQARLTWKPGDPFAGASRASKKQFRWEIMLTAACLTAACGLGCIWLLRTILI